MDKIVLKPQKMTAEIMNQLEELGLIIRIMPSREIHRLKVKPGEVLGGYIYKSDTSAGSHSLVNVALDNSEFFNFGTHPDNEEFLLLGGIGEKKMLLLVSLLTKDKLDTKIATGELTSEDFICLDVVFNDPELSFFVMLQDVPHGECCMGSGLPATFYVTEGSTLGLQKTDFRNYKFMIQES